MNKTKIEWVKNPDGSQGYSWNAITGCLNGCEYCYARKLANTRLKERYLANKNIAIGNDYINMSDLTDKYQMVKFANDPFYPRFWPEKLNLQGMPSGHKGIFVCNMSDLFGIGVPELWTHEVLKTIRFTPYHRFYLLTKQPQNLIKFSPFPDNCYVGVSATDVKMADNGLRYLYDIKASVKFLSIEPLLSWEHSLPISFPPHLDWLILGSQTQPTKHPPREWVDEIITAADKAKIPVFIKEPMASHYGIYRQEFPINSGGRFGR